MLSLILFFLASTFAGSTKSDFCVLSFCSSNFLVSIWPLIFSTSALAFSTSPVPSSSNFLFASEILVFSLPNFSIFFLDFSSEPFSLISLICFSIFNLSLVLSAFALPTACSSVSCAFLRACLAKFICD